MNTSFQEILDQLLQILSVPIRTALEQVMSDEVYMKSMFMAMSMPFIARWIVIGVIAYQPATFNLTNFYNYVCNLTKWHCQLLAMTLCCGIWMFMCVSMIYKASPQSPKFNSLSAIFRLFLMFQVSLIIFWTILLVGATADICFCLQWSSNEFTVKAFLLSDSP